MTNAIPQEYCSFRCAEYFDAYRDGRYDAAGQWWFIVRARDVAIDRARHAMIIGSPGVDGIDFCYREGFDGIWAFYPIEQVWSRAANTLRELETGWLDGSINV